MKNKYFIKLDFSGCVLLFSLFLIIVIIFNLSLWKQEKIIKDDVIAYYAYLPASFIRNDITLKFVDTNPKKYECHFGFFKAPNGNRVIKTTMGVAIMYTPFFLLAHFYAQLFDYPCEGYSEPYHMFIAFSALFYAFLGLLFLRKILQKYFSDIASGMTIILLLFGTNLYYYITGEPGMSHAYSFCLIAMFMYYTMRWMAKPSIRYSIFLGIIFGILSLIRPVNAIVFIIPILYGFTRIQCFKDHLRFIKKNWKLILIIVSASFIIILPQLIYWKSVTGQWVYYSYTNAYGKEGFFFDNPHIIEGLFSYRKGWFLYTPLMVLSILGIPFLKRYCNDYFIPTIFFLVINIYVVLSWYCWWYGGGFGLRAFIDSYALLAVPIAAILTYFLKKHIMLRILLFSILGFFVFLNQYQTFQYRRGVIHWDSMTRQYYWAGFLKKNYLKNADQLISPPDYKKAIKGEE